ncbi:MAG: DUF4838 domain-containing protein, partial [Victivallales bacterium]|nr:DUF4838 domain-containing protein [Victivallales bacterium]
MERAIAIMLLCLICAAGGGELVIVEAGRSEYEIVIRQDAAFNTRLSAKELQEQLVKTSGVMLQIVNKATPGKKSIYVGAHESLPSSADFDPKEYEGKERFRIAELPNGGISIMGAETENDAYSLAELGGDYGLLFGVYEFVERFLGTRWYAPGEFGECIEHKDRIVVKGLPIDQTPLCKGRAFWPRIWVEFTPQDSIKFCRKTRGWGMGTGVGNHSMLDMPNRFPDKPEIFALDADGKTRRMGTLKPNYPDPKSGMRYVSYPQLCLTNPETIDAYCQFVDDVYEGRPEGKLWYSNPPGPKGINVVVNDDFSILPCHCPNCQALIQPEKGAQGAKSNLVWDFVDKTAKRLGKKYPDKVIMALAYQDYYLPPDFKVADNIVVGICVNPYIIFHGAEQYYRRVDQVMKDWSEKCKEISLWHYLTPYDSYPYAMPHIMYRWHHAYPAVKNVFFELNDTLLQRSNLTPLPMNRNVRRGSDMGQLHLDLFFGMKGLWGADLNVDEELNRYYRLFYGPAEKPRKEFFTLIIQRWENVKSDKVTVNEA